jgi:ketosteroid isomerase-like protein
MVTVTPLPDGAPKKMAGNILSVFRKEPDARWVLLRDAILLTPV